MGESQSVRTPVEIDSASLAVSGGAEAPQAIDAAGIGDSKPVRDPESMSDAELDTLIRGLADEIWASNAGTMHESLVQHLVEAETERQRRQR